MTTVAANLSTPSEAAAKATDTESSIPQIESENSTEIRLPTPAREFLDRVGMIDRLSAIGEMNNEIRLEHPNLENLYRVIESSPDLLKRFLKFANSSWFNSRIQVDSPVMAFTRFGTEGFYRLVLVTFVQENIGELSTKFKLWPHLEWSARAGEMVAQQLAPKFVEKTFAAGLLHDAMIAPMERELQDYLYFLECALQVDPVVTGLENSCHGFDHTQAASELARALNFDQCVIDAISAHHHESLTTVPAGDSRTVLSLLLCTKRALSVSRGQKKNAFETATEKTLLREIATALNVSSGRVVNAIADVVDMLHAPATA
jgi:HD-like signal output (HDOD) protein